MNETERLLLEGINRSRSDLYIEYRQAVGAWRCHCFTGQGADIVTIANTLAEAAGAMVERLLELEDRQDEES